MRPLKLTMTAFGPYVKETVLDFEKLGDNGLYLITGNTGSGKTMIFDAISYALYGEAGGDTRDSRSLRSKYADDNTKTKVSLTFLDKGKRYAITRGIKISGSNVVSSVELELPDERIITKVTEAKNEIQNILGIDKSEFSQIAMIAQGEFLKLLNASTTERRKIFGTIFKTDDYKKFQDTVRDIANEIKEKYNKTLQSLEQYIGGVSCDTGSPLYEATTGDGNVETKIDDIIQALEEQITEDETVLKATDDEIGKYEKNLSELKLKFDKDAERRKKQNELCELNKDFTRKQTEQKRAEEKLKTAADNAEQIPMLTENAARINSTLDSYKERDELKGKIDSEKIELEAYRIKVTKNNIAASKLEKEIRLLEEEINSLASAGENIAKLSAEKSETEHRMELLNRFSDVIKSVSAAEKKNRAAKKSFIAAEEGWRKAKSIAGEKRVLFNREQAGILAAELKPGVPCPVCGSLEHPRLAGISAAAPSKEDVEAAQQYADDMQNAYNKETAAANRAENELDNRTKEAAKQAAELFGECDITSAVNKAKELQLQLESKMTALMSEIQNEEEKRSRKQELDRLLPKKKEKQTKLKKDISETEPKISALDSVINEQNSKLNRLSKLEFENAAAAKYQADNLKKQVDNLNKALNKAQTGLNKCQNQTSEIQGQINNLKKLIESAPETDAEELSLQMRNIEQNKNILKQRRDKMYTRCETNKNAYDNIRRQARKFAALEKEQQWKFDLNNAVNGRTLKLETYVQTFYFNRIINRANKHLMKMSNGKYDLAKCSNGSGQAGLDLEVIDHYNDTRRNVGSLSGGESFMASLSLALGLSEEIQCSSGAVKLDTMFIDEGFGTLDSETLNQAMNVLAGLTDDSKLIGIISHVPELKERIDKKIVVEKLHSGGSYAEIKL